MTPVAPDLAQTLNQFIELPSWLETGVDPKVVAALIRTEVSEFQTGECVLDVRSFSGLQMTHNVGCWSGTFTFDTACADHTFDTALVEATLFAPQKALPADVDASTWDAFGSPGWRCWFPEQRLLLTHKEYVAPATALRGPTPEQAYLEDVLRDTVRINDPAVWTTLTGYVRHTGITLATFHQANVQHAKHVTWNDLRDDVGRQIERLTIAFPELMNGVKAILARIEAIAASTPADADVPSQGGFLDPDLLCMAEPSHDLSRFRVLLKTYGCDHSFTNRAALLERIAQLDAVNEDFLEAYESGASVSRERLALWEALSYLNELLHTWTTARLEDRSARVAMLETHLRGLGM